MTPLEFLREELKNVSALLNETLRREYEPEGRIDYYLECKRRLNAIEQAVVEAKEGELKNISPSS